MALNTKLGLLHAIGGVGTGDVEQDRADDDRAGEECLPRRLQTAGRQTVFQHRHDEHADERADHRAGAAGHGRAADDNAGDAVHFLTCARARGDGGVGGGVEQTRHSSNLLDAAFVCHE